jgi:peptide/nickel transport system permease protein
MAASNPVRREARGEGNRLGAQSTSPPGKRSQALRQLATNPAAVGSALFLLVVVIASLLAPLLSAYDPNVVDPVNRLLRPGGEYWFGTDDLGRDTLTRALYGARVSLWVGFSVTVMSAVVGSILGLIAGFYDAFDNLIMRIMDGFMAFPSILLAIAIMASLGPRTTNVIIALTAVYTPQIARLVRGTTLAIREQAYVESARVIGASDARILTRYILANSLSPLIVQSTFIFAFAIIAEASLSFLGAGVPPDLPTWGNMLREGQRLLTTAWWLCVLPGTLLFVTVLALNLFGDGLRDALDPRSRER